MICTQNSGHISFECSAESLLFVCITFVMATVRCSEPDRCFIFDGFKSEMNLQGKINRLFCSLNAQWQSALL